jgi:hypothetical protein
MRSACASRRFLSIAAWISRLFHVRLHALDIHTDLSGDLGDPALVHRAPPLHERLVERHIFALPVDRQRGLGRERGIRPEDREFLVDDAQLRVGRFRLADHRSNLAAVGAVVVEELDQRHVAVRVAAHRALAIAQDLVRTRLDDGLPFALLHRLLTRLVPPSCFDDDLRVFKDVGAHPLLECVLWNVGRQVRGEAVRPEPRVEREPRTGCDEQDDRHEQPCEGFARGRLACHPLIHDQASLHRRQRGAHAPLPPSALQLAPPSRLTITLCACVRESKVTA